MKTKGRQLIALIFAFVTVFALTATGAAASPSINDYELADDGRTLVRYLGDSSDIYIPVGVSTIKAGAIPDELADKITSITFPESVRTVERGAFPDPMPNLRDVYFREMYEDWSDDFPTDPDDPLRRLAYGDGVNRHLLSEPNGFMFYGTALKKFEGWYTIVEIPLGVTEIGPRAFAGSWSDGGGRPITGVIIPDSVTTIGGSAFLSCDKLKTVTMADSVKTIKDFAFSCCSSLTDITIPDSVTAIGDNAFSNCQGLSTITIPGSVKELGRRVFFGCSALTDVTLSSGVTEIAAEMFKDCSSLTHIDIPEGVTTISANAFEGCTSLTSVTIPGSVTTISANAFEGCTSLTSITIPSSVTTIDAEAFKGCSNLKNVVLANGAVMVGDDVFAGTPWLAAQAAAQSGDFFMIGSTLERYRGSDSKVVIPEGVTRVASDAFKDCGFIKHITLPESIAGLQAIRHRDNVSYSIPESVVTITFPKKGLLVEDAAAYDPRDFYGSFSYLKHLRRVINCPNPGAEEYFARIDVYAETWVNPGKCISSRPQSERIIQLSNEITAGLTGDYEKAKAICRWISENIEYDYDYYYGKKKTVTVRPEAVLDSRLTVCQGYTELTQALLEAQAIPVQSLVGYTSNAQGKEELHAWNTAFVDGRWIMIDTTWREFDFPLLSFVQDHRIAHEESYRDSTAEKDIPSDWAKEEVWEAISSYVVPYDLQASYRSAITREEFCRLMVKLVEKSVGQNINSYIASKGLSVTDPFADTDTPEVLAAYALGIVQGTSANTFNPSGSITRQEAATMLARTAKVLGLSMSSGMTFADAGSFASWARENIAFVSGLTDPVTGNRVMNGTGNGCFSPKGTYTREQAIATALRLFHCAQSG